MPLMKNQQRSRNQVTNGITIISIIPPGRVVYPDLTIRKRTPMARWTIIRKAMNVKKRAK